MRGLVAWYSSAPLAGAASPTRFLTESVRQHVASRWKLFTDLTNAAAGDAGDGDEVVRLRTQLSELAPLAHHAADLQRLEAAWRECEAQAASEEVRAEPEMAALVAQEQCDLSVRIRDTEDALVAQLLPEEEDMEASEVVLEVRAGTGGSEAQLFTQEVFGLYEQHAARRGWRFRVMSISQGDVGGYREAIAVINGDAVYAALRFEGGVHRVQRKPLTDKTRVHTSTATVAVLPAPPQDEPVVIPDSELKIDTFRAGGAGGQHVNTTDSAIRVTHLPTGIVVSIQDDRSQHKNKAAALALVQAKVHEMRRQEQQAKRASSRRSMIGTGDRSERIRTYNFPQDRITDHRIQHSETGMDRMMAGELVDTFGELLSAAHVRDRLEEFCANNASSKS